MSLIRIAVPGQPVILVDEGPNTGRTSFSRGAMRNTGEYVVAKPVKYSGRVDPRQGKHAKVQP